MIIVLVQSYTEILQLWRTIWINKIIFRKNSPGSVLQKQYIPWNMRMVCDVLFCWAYITSFSCTYIFQGCCTGTGAILCVCEVILKNMGQLVPEHHKKQTMPIFHGMYRTVNSLRPNDAYLRQWTNIIGSDNGLSPGPHQAIIRTNNGILLIGPLGTNFSEISIKSQTFSFTKMRLKVSSA